MRRKCHRQSAPAGRSAGFRSRRWASRSPRSPATWAKAWPAPPRQPASCCPMQSCAAARRRCSQSRPRRRVLAWPKVSKSCQLACTAHVLGHLHPAPIPKELGMPLHASQSGTPTLSPSFLLGRPAAGRRAHRRRPPHRAERAAEAAAAHRGAAAAGAAARAAGRTSGCAGGPAAGAAGMQGHRCAVPCNRCLLFERSERQAPMSPPHTSTLQLAGQVPGRFHAYQALDPYFASACAGACRWPSSCTRMPPRSCARGCGWRCWSTRSWCQSTRQAPLSASPCRAAAAHSSVCPLLPLPSWSVQAPCKVSAWTHFLSLKVSAASWRVADAGS